MAFVRKVTRILLKTLKYLVIVLVLLLTFLIIAVNTESFQTWLAQKATAYLSDELDAKVQVDKVSLSFIRSATLENVFIEDQKHDTLLFSKKMDVSLSGFNYRERRLRIDKLELIDTKAYLVRYRDKEDLNLQFLIDYFASKDTTRTKNPWKIEYGKLVLNNVDFKFRNEHRDVSVSENMNYNNLFVQHITGEISGINIVNDSVYAKISGLKAMEQSGFVLDNLNTVVKVSSKNLVCHQLKIKTPNSTIMGEFTFSYNNWKDYNDFLNKIRIRANLDHGTVLNFRDIAYFAKELNGFDKTIKFSGAVNGFVNNFLGEQIDIEFEKNTHFSGAVSMSGLPDFKSTFIHLDVKHLSTSMSDLEKIPSYPFSEKKYLSIPNEIGKLGLVSFTGKFDGFANDFITYGKFKTAVGNLNTDLAIRIDTVKDVISYKGKIKTDQFNIGRLFNVNKLGIVALNLEVKGKGVSLKDVDAVLDGKVDNFQFNGYNYKNITVNGNIRNKIFKGLLVSKDENADFDFNGEVDFTNKIPDIDFISTVNKLDLRALGFVTRDGVISSQILIQLKGDGLDNLSGLVNFDNTIYTTPEKVFKLSTFDLQMDQETENKKIRLTSNYANFLAEGKFKLSTLSGSVYNFLSHYYPTFFKKDKSKVVYNDQLTFNVVVKKFNTINELFFQDLMISPNTVVNGKFDASARQMNVSAASDSINYKNIDLKKCSLDVHTNSSDIVLALNGESINLSDSSNFRNFALNVHSKDKDTDYDFTWDNRQTPQYAGELKGSVSFGPHSVTLNYDKVNITMKDSAWRMTTSNTTVIDSSGTVTVDPLIFVRGNQMFNIQGKLTNNPSDKVDFNLSNFDLQQLDPLMAAFKLNLNGTVNGVFSLHNKIKNLTFSSDLTFSGVKINGNALGDGQLKTEYNTTQKYLFIDGYTSFGFENTIGEKLRNLNFSGYYYLDRKEESLDINIDANPASLTLLNPILKGILTIKTGLVTGKGKLTGTPKSPNISGQFKLAKCDIMVDYLGVTYSLLGEISLQNDQIRFEDIKLTHAAPKKNTSGLINGNIFHKGFKDMRVDFDINFTNMLVLDKPSSEEASFYGKAYATGNFGIFGFLDDVKMDIRAKTEKGTVFSVPLGGPAEVSESSFIRFVSRDTVKKKEVEKRSNFSLEMNLTATPDAEAQVIFDEKSGDVIKGRGNGDLQMKINNLGKFDMFGNYTLASGEYLFTLENFITKKFDIAKGSTVKWSGDPYNADIDIVAIYKQRSSISPLFPNDTQSISKRRFPVNTKLIMKDKLLTPVITFSVELPTLDEATKTRVATLLTDEAELNRQVFSLLLLNSFVTPIQYSQGGGVSAGSAVAANSSEMLSNRISGWLNGLTNKVDIGVNYSPGNSINSEELSVALSKQLLNNRLSFDTNLGVASGTNTTGSQNMLIGDVVVEYKLTEDGRYRVKAFNRSNDNTQMTTTGGPYTQGVGVFYREEFETWQELYRRYLAKLKGENKDQETPPKEEQKSKDTQTISEENTEK